MSSTQLLVIARQGPPGASDAPAVFRTFRRQSVFFSEYAANEPRPLRRLRLADAEWRTPKAKWMDESFAKPILTVPLHAGGEC